jgi:hypothetical protein
MSKQSTLRRIERAELAASGDFLAEGVAAMDLLDPSLHSPNAAL